MQARKIMAGSLLAAGLGVAGAIGSMGTAQAAPGVAVSVSGVSAGIGDAQASSTIGNAAIGLNGGTASANGGFGNLAIANADGVHDGAYASTDGSGVGNVALASGIDSRAVICGSCSNGNVAAAIGDGADASVENGNGNLVLAVGTNSLARVENGSLNTSTAVCGGSSIVSAQSAQIRVSAPCVGI